MSPVNVYLEMLKVCIFQLPLNHIEYYEVTQVPSKQKFFYEEQTFGANFPYFNCTWKNWLAIINCYMYIWGVQQ